MGRNLIDTPLEIGKKQGDMREKTSFYNWICLLNLEQINFTYVIR